MNRDSKPHSTEAGWYNAIQLDAPINGWLIGWDTAQRKMPEGTFPAPWHVEHIPSGLLTWCEDRNVLEAVLSQIRAGQATHPVAKGFLIELTSWARENPTILVDNAAEAAVVGKAVAKKRGRPKLKENGQKVEVEVVVLKPESDVDKADRIGRQLSSPAREQANQLAKELEAVDYKDIIDLFREGFASEQSFVVKDGPNESHVETAPDYRTRLGWVTLFLAYREGDPIKRQQIIHAQEPMTVEKLMEFLNTNAEARRALRMALDEADAKMKPA